MTKLVVVGTIGLAGTEMLETLNRKNAPLDELILFSSARSAGWEVELQGETHTVQELINAHVSEHFDYILMSVGGDTSEHFVPLSEKAGTIVINSSSRWRMVEDIDSIVPEVSEPTFTRDITANPNCSTIQPVMPLKVLQDVYGLKRVAYTACRTVSGSRMKGKKDLVEGVNGKAPKTYPHLIYNNALPYIDVFLEDRYAKEEQKMIDETRRVLNTPNLEVTAICAHVPVQDSHSVEIDITPDKETTTEDIKALFDQNDRVALVDNPENSEYPMTINSTNKDEMFAGRTRRDDPLENIFHVRCTPDSLLRGAALNAIRVLG